MIPLHDCAPARVLRMWLTGIALHGVQGMLAVNPSLVEICLDSNFIGAVGKDALMAGAPNC